MNEPCSQCVIDTSNRGAFAESVLCTHRKTEGVYVTPRREYHAVQGAYVDKSTPPDPFIVGLQQELRATLARQKAEAERLRQTRVEVTIRVVPMDTTKTVTEATTALLFDDTRSQKQRQADVESAARALYPTAAHTVIPTPEREGGRG